jgi:hypothetical protein
MLRPTISVTSSSAFSSSLLLTATTLPLLITVTLSQTRITSSSLCVTKTTPIPCAAIDRMLSKSCVVSCGVRIDVGSSSISTRAFLTRSFRISTCCFWEAVSCHTYASGSRFQPYSLMVETSISLRLL